MSVNKEITMDTVEGAIVAKNEEQEGGEEVKNKVYQAPRSRNNTNGSAGSIMSKLGGSLLLDSIRTFNGDIVYDDVEDRGNAFMKKDDSGFGVTGTAIDANGGDDNENNHSDKGNESRSAKKKGRGNHSHYRSLSGLFSESASISGINNLGNINLKPHAAKNENNKSYPCQQLRSNQQGEHINEDDSTTGKKHRRMYSGGVSNPSMAHRRINSGGNAAFIHRHSLSPIATAMSANANTSAQYSNTGSSNSNTSYNPIHSHYHQPIPALRDYQNSNPFYSHNQPHHRPRSLSPIGSPKYKSNNATRRQHCRDDSDINFPRTSTIDDDAPVAAAKWLENMRRSPPIDSQFVEFADQYSTSSTSSIAPTMAAVGRNTTTKYHHDGSNRNQYPPPPPRFSRNNMGSASNSRSSSPSMYYPNTNFYGYNYGARKVPSPPESTYQPASTSHHPQVYPHQQLVNDGLNAVRQQEQQPQSYLGNKHFSGQGSRLLAFNTNYHPRTSSSPPDFPYYPSQVPPPPATNSSNIMRSSCSSSSASSSPSQAYPIQQSLALPYYAAAHAAARETTLGLPHHPLATEQLSRQRPIPLIRDTSIKSIESKIETDEPLFKKDGVSPPSLSTTEVASQAVSSSGAFNRGSGSGGYPPIPRPPSNQPHYRISPQLFQESLKEHSNFTESPPDSLTFNDIGYQESLLSSLVNPNTASSQQPEQHKLHDNSHHKRSSNSSGDLLHSFDRDIDKQQTQRAVDPNSSQYQRTNSTGSLVFENNALFGEKFLEPDTMSSVPSTMSSSPTQASSIIKTDNVPGTSSLPCPIKNQYESNPTLKSATLSSTSQPKSEMIQPKLKDTSQSTETKATTTPTAVPSAGRKISGGVSKRVRRKCSVAECTNRVVQGGLCIAHGAKRKLCGHPGCKKHVKKAGMCSTHGPARKRCEVEGCAKVSVQGGKCIAHGAKKKLCSVNSCTKQAILSGMCKKHHDQEKLKIDSGVDQFSASQNVPMCTYCIPAKENEGNSPEINITTVNANRPDNQTAPSAQHRRGLSIFQDMSTVNTIIGVSPTGDNEASASLSRKPAGSTSRERERSHGPPTHKRGLSIFGDEEVVDKIVQNKFGI